MSTTSPKVLLFTVATNGYDKVYDDFIVTQVKYAERMGYTYFVADRPRKNVTAVDSAWMKIAIIVSGLEKGYDWVAFMDADCEILDHCPRIETMEVPGKSVYMAIGHSKRVNSGVIIVKNTPETLKAFKKLMYLSDVPGRFLGKGNAARFENGHVIAHSKKWPFLEIISNVWNNNLGVDMNEFVKHHGGVSELNKHKRPDPATVTEEFVTPKGPRFWRLRALKKFSERVYKF
jgi:hypothetical protein